jgi:hypothetical protein
MLLDWLEGRLDLETGDRVAAHVAGTDERTRRTVEWLSGFLATARALPLHDPPPIVRQSLDQYFARWSRARAELGQQPREVRAQLLFDSRLDLAAAGVRAGASDDEAVHLVYTADEGDLLIDVYPLGPGSVRLDGQMLPTSPGEAPIFEASVAGPGFTVRTKDGDELGRFRLKDVPERQCQLRASNGLITVVADLNLDPGPD